VSTDPGPIPRPIRFGEDLELDPAAYQLRRAGRPLKLERIPLDILLLLTERAGQLVTREQIAERIWGKGAFLDVDNSLNGAIRKIRHALEDDPEQPRFIQTVTGRGYRFVATVIDTPSTQPPPPPEAAPPRFRIRLALVALPLLLAGAFVWSRLESARVPHGRVMLAVLPFQNLTGDAGQEYLSDGLTEEMIAQLGNRDPTGLGVIARTSVMRYKGSQEPPERIARALGVQYLLSGSVRRDSSTIRVTAQLVRARDQAQLWSDQYDRRPSGLLTLEEEIAREIGDAIESSLGSRARAAPGKGPAPARDAQAYDLFLRGQYFFNKRTETDLDTAVTYLDRATQREPGFARGWAALASAEVLLAVYSIQPPQQLVARARASALKALELDPALAEAHTALALIVQNHDWDWPAAEREFRQAIALNPSYATAHHWYAEHLLWRGRFDDALRESELARQLDPLSLIIAADNGAILYFSRQYDRAIDKLRSVNAIDPNLSRAYLLVATYTNAGKFDQALAEEAHWRPLVQEPVHWATLAYIYGRAGRTADAQRAIRQLEQLSRRAPVQARVFIWAYAGVEDTEQTLAWLEKAAAERSGEMVTIKVNPIYDFVRGDPRFRRLVERVGLGG
jgi:TolB-like protein/DNA-binding winged helix-turn-helix (wHTH) protein/Tfp pilus assembly protein PilF